MRLEQPADSILKSLWFAESDSADSTTSSCTTTSPSFHPTSRSTRQAPRGRVGYACGKATLEVAIASFAQKRCLPTWRSSERSCSQVSGVTSGDANGQGALPIFRKLRMGLMAFGTGHNHPTVVLHWYKTRSRALSSHLLLVIKPGTSCKVRRHQSRRRRLGTVG